MTSWLPPLRALGPGPLHYRPLCSGRQAGQRRPRRSLLRGLRLQLDVVLNSDLDDQVQLRLDEIDMFLLALEDLAEQVPGHEISHPFAVGDCFAQLGHRQLFELQITLEYLLYGLADQQLVQFETRFAVQEQEALDQHVGMFHLVDRFVVLMGAELDYTPVLQHAGMKKVLVEGGHLVLQNGVEVNEDGRVTLYGRPLWLGENANAGS